jgi:translation initiation factor IF-3
VRVITEDGEQLGVFTLQDALAKAQEKGLDLVEIAPTATPPVCKIIDYGKLRYQQTKREKLNRKASHQTKIKEIKLKPNIDKHDLDTKIKHAREFIEKGCKVKFTCMFRGREIVFADNGKQVLTTIIEALEEVAQPESPPKMFGKSLMMLLVPSTKEKKIKEKKSVHEGQSEEL